MSALSPRESRYVGQYAHAIVCTWDVRRHMDRTMSDALDRFERTCDAGRLEVLQECARGIAQDCTRDGRG